MGELFQPWHLVVLFLVFCTIFVLPAIFYILTVQKLLNKCAPGSRTLDPNLVWLFIIPLVGLVFTSLSCSA